ncbi:MAG: T9SS type A sorting domain-containing protein [Bacteroidota bacterium]|nr:T9SS type A sorting domain-containing protein [Bacteroidota bacterium]
MIDYRKVDGTLALATHGRGLFYARIFEKGAILSKEKMSPSNEINIFPNPGVGVLRMRSSEEVMQKVTIVNASGKKVEEISSSNRRFEINTESWDLGLYFLIVETQSGKSWLKWIKEQ